MATTVFPFIDSCTLQNLKMELPHYRAACQDVCPSFDESKFWETHAMALNNWSVAAAKTGLVQPSSAAAERAFSILKMCCNHT